VEEDIKIAFDQADIERQSQDEKLNLLLKIAFSNHTTLREHGQILFGNGKAGLCDIARTNKMLINIIMSVVGASILSFAGVLYGLLAGK
jgi:hypothetical protein